MPHHEERASMFVLLGGVWTPEKEAKAQLKATGSGYHTLKIKEDEVIWTKTFTVYSEKFTCPFCCSLIRVNRHVCNNRRPLVSVKWKRSGCRNPVCKEYVDSGTPQTFKDWLAKAYPHGMKESEVPELKRIRFLYGCETDWLERDIRDAMDAAKAVQ